MEGRDAIVEEVVLTDFVVREFEGGSGGSRE